MATPSRTGLWPTFAIMFRQILSQYLFPQISTMPYMSKALNAKVRRLYERLQHHSEASHRTGGIDRKPPLNRRGISTCDVHMSLTTRHIAIAPHSGRVKSALSNSHKINTHTNVATVNKTAATFVSFISAHHHLSACPRFLSQIPTYPFLKSKPAINQ